MRRHSSLSLWRRLESGKRFISAAYSAPLTVRLLFATLAVGAATAARLAMTPILGERLPYATAHLALEVSALLGGAIPGLFATLLSALFSHLWIAPIDLPIERIGLALFVASGAVLSLIAEALHRVWLELSEVDAERQAADRAYISDRHFMVAISSGEIGAWNLDLATNVSTVAGKTHAIYGLEPGSIINPSAVSEVILPEDVEGARGDFRKALDPLGDGQFHSEYRIRRPSDQAIRWISARGQTLFENGAPTRVIGVSRDITDEKVAASALLERARVSELLTSVALAAPGVMGTFYLDADNHVAYRYVSPKAWTIFGIDPAEICTDARAFFKRLNRADLERLNAGLFRSQRELCLFVIDFLFDHPQRGMIWMEAQAAPVREADGRVVWHGYASDVTARKRVELSLLESAERLRATIDAAQDAVLTMDASGRIQSVNRAGEAMFGYGAEALNGMYVDALIAPPDGDKLRLAELLSTAAGGNRCEIEGRRREGTVFPAELTLSETRLDDERLLVAFVKDLTEQRKFERQVEELHRSRLDAMGGMAAALAHEINQPLAANATYLKVVRRMLEKLPAQETSEISEVLEKATAQTLRAGRIVGSLRDLARRGEPDKTLVSVNAIVREALDSFLTDGARPDIATHLDFGASTDQVVADHTQLRQVLVNLIRNAAEAMQSSQRRELVVSTVNPDATTIRVDVFDTGCGLPDAAESGVFAPFTTTKAKGMGVGLSISRSIIEAHYGRIWAAPREGGGSTFSFTLPLCDPDVDE